MHPVSPLPFPLPAVLLPADLDLDLDAALQPLSAVLGFPTPLLRYTLAMFLALPLAALFRLARGPMRTSPTPPPSHVSPGAH